MHFAGQVRDHEGGGGRAERRGGGPGNCKHSPLMADDIYWPLIGSQHHPVLQRKGDKAVQLLCFFAAQDKVVTNSYDVLAE